MSDKRYNNSEELLKQAFKGIEMGAKALQDYADEPYFSDNRYDSISPAFDIYLKIGEALSSAQWARRARQEDEKYKAAKLAVASLDDVPVPSQTKSSYSIDGSSITLEFASSDDLSESDILRYKNFVVASMGNSPISDSSALSKAITSFESNKELVLGEFNEISEEAELLPIGFKSYLLETAKASGSITEKGEAQLNEIQEELPFIEAETTIGTICAKTIDTGSEVFLKLEDGSLAEIAKASNIEVMNGVFISIENGKVTSLDAREMMKIIRDAE